jgi:hypothetical protein
MSTAVEINGVTLVPIKEAASRVKYSHDYVSRLAREGKIVASQIGRKWFVDPVSLETFSAEASMLEEVRKEELRQERKRELMAKEALATLGAHMDSKASRYHFDAMAVTAAVVCLGLFVGATLYTTSNALRLSDGTAKGVSAVVSLEKEASLAVGDPSPFRVIAEPTDVLVTSIVEEPISTVTAKVVPLDAAELEAGIVLFTPGETVDEETVAAMFSDPVEVEFTGETGGVVSYDRGDGEVAEYPFIRIPANDTEEVPNGTE